MAVASSASVSARNRIRHLHNGRWLIGSALALLFVTPVQAQLRGTSPGSATPVPPAYHVKPSDVTLPPGAKPGDIRRIIQPFAAWTLICDENLKAHTRICNVSQTLVDDSGRMVFSWSLAATRDGSPVFILRAPVAGQDDHTLTVDFGKTGTKAVPVSLSQCDTSICIGFLPVTQEIRASITARAEVRVQLADRAGAPIVTRAPLDGLAAAIASIK